MEIRPRLPRIHIKRDRVTGADRREEGRNVGLGLGTSVPWPNRPPASVMPAAVPMWLRGCLGFGLEDGLALHPVPAMPVDAVPHGRRQSAHKNRPHGAQPQTEAET